MGEHRRDAQFRIALHDVDETGKILHVEAQAVHSRIHLDVDVEGRDFRMPRQHLLQLLQIVEVEDFRLEAVVDHHLEAVGFGTEHDNRRVDAAFAQADSLVGIGNSQVINSLVQQRIDQFHIAEPIRGGFHHGHHLRVGTETVAMEIEVVGQRGQVHLHNRQVGFMLQSIDNLFEMEIPGAFHQDDFVGNGQLGQMVQQVGRVMVKQLFFQIEDSSVTFKAAADCNQTADMMPFQLGVQASEVLFRQLSYLFEIGDNERLFRHLRLRVEEVQSGRQRVDIQAVSVVDNHRMVSAFQDFQSHADMREPS